MTTAQTFQRALTAAKILGVPLDKRADVASKALGVEIPEFIDNPAAYSHQHGTADPVTFSAKACNVAGVQYKPKWAWSADYRSHFRKSVSCKTKDRLYLDSAARSYAIWYRTTPGTTYNETV